MTPVIKAYGKKNPENQKVLGVPFLAQFLKNSHLWIKSIVQLPKGFKLKNPTSLHISGT
jgi:hypothetical protein